MSTIAIPSDRRLFALLLAGAPVAVSQLVDGLSVLFLVQEMPFGGVAVRQITSSGGLLNGDVFSGGVPVLLLALAHVLALIAVSIVCGRYLESKGERVIFAIGYALLIAVPRLVVPAIVAVSGNLTLSGIGYVLLGSLVLASIAYFAARVSRQAIQRSS